MNMKLIICISLILVFIFVDESSGQSKAEGKKVGLKKFLKKKFGGKNPPKKIMPNPNGVNFRNIVAECLKSIDVRGIITTNGRTNAFRNQMADCLKRKNGN